MQPPVSNPERRLAAKPSLPRIVYISKRVRVAQRFSTHIAPISSMAYTMPAIVLQRKSEEMVRMIIENWTGREKLVWLKRKDLLAGFSESPFSGDIIP